MANISNDVIIGLSVMAGVVVLFVAAVIVATYDAKKKIQSFHVDTQRNILKTRQKGIFNGRYYKK